MKHNPYTDLLNEAREFCRKIRFAQATSHSMFFWSVDKLTSDRSWRVDDLYQRALAAKTLGYEVVVEADEKGMTTRYRKKVDAPSRFT